MGTKGQTDTKLIITFRNFAKTPKFDWFTGIRKRNQTIETSTEKFLSFADNIGLNKQEVSEQFLCWDKL
jgi:hypothetical protein